MVEGSITITEHHPVHSGFQSPKLFFLIENTSQFCLELPFQINKTVGQPKSYTSLDSIQPGYDLSLFCKNIAKMDFIPVCGIPRESSDSILKVMALTPSLLDNPGEGGA